MSESVRVLLLLLLCACIVSTETGKKWTAFVSRYQQG